jgi:hypothetical protein
MLARRLAEVIRGLQGIAVRYESDANRCAVDRRVLHDRARRDRPRERARDAWSGESHEACGCSPRTGSGWLVEGDSVIDITARAEGVTSVLA